MQKVVVIGGGASGLVGAINAARLGNEVILLERNSSVGKKILITGNGRCNYFNADQNLRHYHSSNDDILSEIITDNNLNLVLEFFDSIGIVPKVRNGYYYPNSNQAISVKEALLFECELLGIQIINDVFVSSIKKDLDKFIINGNIEADKVILATGSMAAPKTGSDGNGYALASSLGHTIIKPLPALVQLVSDGKFLKEWSGIRCDVKASLYEDGNVVLEETGEIQLTDYGVSGICIFNLSGRCARGIDLGMNEEVIINFLPDVNDFMSFMELRNKKVRGRNISRLFDGLLNYKLVNVLLDMANISKDKMYDDLSSFEKEKLRDVVCGFKLKIKGTKSFDNAQVCSGGVPLCEVNPLTMESKRCENLYLTGELLDVDGDCGGYNLTFAFVSGMLAGKDLK